MPGNSRDRTTLINNDSSAMATTCHRLLSAYPYLAFAPTEAPGPPRQWRWCACWASRSAIPLRLPSAPDQGLQGGGHIGLAHQGLAHQHGIGTGTHHPVEIVAVDQARFAHQQGAALAQL